MKRKILLLVLTFIFIIPVSLGFLGTSLFDTDNVISKTYTLNCTNNCSSLFSVINSNDTITGVTGNFVNLTASSNLCIGNFCISGWNRINGSAFPGGANGEIQYNDNGFFNGDSGMHYNKTEMLFTHTGTVDIIHTSSEADDHALEIDIFANGFGDNKAIDIDYVTGMLTDGHEEEGILINLDDHQATGGSFAFLENIATEGGLNHLIGMEVGALIDPIFQLSGVFVNPTATSNNGVNDTFNSTSTSANSSVFVNDNDYITIEYVDHFEEIEFILEVGASGAGISPVYEYSTGVNTWGTFVPTDGTNAFRNTGVILWIRDDIPLWTTGASGNYIIRINRTRNAMSTTPKIGFSKVASTTVYGWDDEGEVYIANLNVTGESIFEDTINILAGVPTIIFDDLHPGHDNYRIRIDEDVLKIGSGSPTVDYLIITGDGNPTFQINNTNTTFEQNVYVNGNVGIGTSTPGETLEVVGNINSTTGDICITGGNCLSEVITFASVNGNVNSTSWHRQPAANPFHGEDVILANADDWVGIGTNAPETELHVNGTALNTYFIGTSQSSFVMQARSGISGSEALQWVMLNNGLSKFRGLSDNLGGVATDNIVVMNLTNGNVGIGTATPSSLLDIDGDTGSGIIEIDGDSGGCVQIRDTDNAGWTSVTTLNGVATWSSGVC